jgi:hypothetical protein
MLQCALSRGTASLPCWLVVCAQSALPGSARSSTAALGELALCPMLRAALDVHVQRHQTFVCASQNGPVCLDLVYEIRKQMQQFDGNAVRVPEITTLKDFLCLFGLAAQVCPRIVRAGSQQRSLVSLNTLHHEEVGCKARWDTDCDSAWRGNRGGKPWLDAEIWGSRPRRFAVVLPYCSSTPQITQNARTRTTCVCFVVNRLELGRAAADRAGAAY